MGAFSPHLPFDSLSPPTELIISVEISRRPRDTAESVRHFLPHCRGAEGLGRMEGGSRVTGPPAHWEGIETGGMVVCLSSVFVFWRLWGTRAGGGVSEDRE